MGFSEFELKKAEILLNDFIKSIRPPENIRDQLDIAYRIEKQSVYIFEIRPQYLNPEKKAHIEIAKTTFIKSRNVWKIFWMRADLKWHGYEPDLYVDDLKEFIRIVREDEYACFWG